MIQNLIETTKKSFVESQYVTKPTRVCDELETYLSNIFEKELNTEDSVLLAYNPFVIKKIVGYLSICKPCFKIFLHFVSCPISYS